MNTPKLKQLQNVYHRIKRLDPIESTFKVAGSATEWILSGPKIYGKGRILL